MESVSLSDFISSIEVYCNFGDQQITTSAQCTPGNHIFCDACISNHLQSMTVGMVAGCNENCDVSKLSKEVGAKSIELIKLLKVQTDWAAEPKVKGDDHQNDADVFGDTCKKFICYQCAADNKAFHEGHAFKTVKVYNGSVKDELGQKLNLLEATRKEIEDGRPDFGNKKDYANGLLDNIEQVIINTIRAKIKEIKGNVEKTIDLTPYDENVQLIKAGIEDVRTTKDSRRIPTHGRVEELKTNSDANNTKGSEETNRYKDVTKHLKLEYDVVEDTFSANVQQIIDQQSKTVEIKSEKCGDISLSIAFSASNNNVHTFSVTGKIPADCVFIYKMRHLTQQSGKLVEQKDKFDVTKDSSYSFTFTWEGDLAPTPPEAANPDPNAAQQPVAVAKREECDIKLSLQIMKINQETVEFFKNARQIMGLVDNFEFFLLPKEKVTK